MAGGGATVSTGGRRHQTAPVYLGRAEPTGPRRSGGPRADHEISGAGSFVFEIGPTGRPVGCSYDFVDSIVNFFPAAAAAHLLRQIW